VLNTVDGHAGGARCGDIEPKLKNRSEIQGKAVMMKLKCAVQFPHTIKFSK
jgi:hypothetical protein